MRSYNLILSLAVAASLIGAIAPDAPDVLTPIVTAQFAQPEPVFFEAAHGFRAPIHRRLPVHHAASLNPLPLVMCINSLPGISGNTNQVERSFVVWSKGSFS